MSEPGVEVDRATLNKWVVTYAPMFATEAQKRKRATAVSWRMDEAYVKGKGEWMYLYRAMDRDGKSSNSRSRNAATKLLRRGSSNAQPK